MNNKMIDTANYGLRIGEKVHIGLEEGAQAYPTLLEDILDDGRLVVSSPQHRGIPLPLWQGREVQLYFYRENGRFCVHSKVDELFKQNGLLLLGLAPLSEPIKQQRRESFRLPVNLDARLRSFRNSGLPEPVAYIRIQESEWETTITRNLSETGVSIKSQHQYSLGDMVHIRMYLDDGGEEELELLGIVRQMDRLEEITMPAFRLGIEFMPYEEKTRRIIAKFILKRQQIVLKMKRTEGKDWI